MNSLMNNEYINIAISYLTDSSMSIFILGILTGWLVEWIFYNLFWKQSENKEIAKNTSEAPSSNKVIEETKEPKKEQQPEKIDKTKKKKDTKQENQKITNSKDESTEQETGSVEDKQTEKKQAEPKSKSDKEKQATETSTKDQQESQQKEKDQATEKKTPEKVEKKQPVKKAKPAKADDFTKLYGVGPSIAKSLKGIGVDSFKQLSESNTDELIEKLTANGTKVMNKSAMESWAEQAKLADAGDFDGLKAFQDELKKS